MKPTYPYPTLLLVAAVFLVVSAGCSSLQSEPNSSSKSSGTGEKSPSKAQTHRAQINSIGLQSIITFERNPTSSILIPIEGFHLRENPAGGNASSRTENITVQVIGTVPAVPDIDYKLVWGDSKKNSAPNTADTDLAYVQLEPNYVAKLKAHDRLRIIAAVHRQATEVKSGLLETQNFPESTAIAHREFTVYDVETYRNEVAKARVPAHDIQAFPIPEKEVQYLFGPLVAKSYFVMRLTLRNTSDTDKLVNSGLISATGRAIVEPANRYQPTFTVPVTLSPQGPIQVYAILDDQTPWRRRPWVFRSLEFIGALSSTAVTTFTHTPTDLVKGTALFTGVVIPESQKLWPDDWPGYKRNLVTFAMPELTKIPRQSTSSPKYLFFPKRELELFVSDQSLFEKLSITKSIAGIPWRTSEDSAKPVVRIVSIGFDSLDIPFENALEPGQISLATRIGRLNDQLETQIDKLTQFKNRLEAANKLTNKDDAFVLGSATLGRLRASRNALQETFNVISSKSPNDIILGLPVDANESIKAAEYDSLKQALQNLIFVVESMVDLTDSSSGLYHSILTDTSKAAFSLDALKHLEKNVSRTAAVDVLTYSNSLYSEAKINAINHRLEASQSLLAFIESAARTLTGQELLSMLSSIGKKEGKTGKEERSLIFSLYATLKAQRNIPALPQFDGLGFQKIADRYFQELSAIEREN